MKKIFKITAILLLFSVVYSQNASGSVVDENEAIKKINQEIQSKKRQVQQIQSNQERYVQLIKEKVNEKLSLQNELSLLDNRIAKAELDIENAQTEIDRTNLEIKKTALEIEEKNEKIIEEKDRIAKILKLIYKNDNVSTLEVLLLNNSLSDFLSQVKYLEDVNTEMKDSVQALDQYKNQLEDQNALLNKKNEELALLKKDLENKRAALSSEKDNKVYIIDQTNMSEMQFRSLLAQAKQEQIAAALDISNLETTAREKMAKLSKDKIKLNDNGFIWPVPKNVITAYFHDPEYPFRNIFEHPAVDIRSPQSTNIRATASGYVARAHNGGKAYSYIMLVHGNGMSSVYGHVSKILVKEDEFVLQGQVIGLSGGMPGTSGAGSLTTGPHLHFEVRQNGIPVNPLNYLQ